MRETQAGYWLDRDYLDFALPINYPGKLNPQINIDVFCDRWNLSTDDFYRALGDLKTEGIVESISNRLDLHLQETV
ncbi:hypothetical protein H6F76_02155 [Leptolyngbya sp. FACHB-321]|uniref:hypothetical protein n=1 Tax=Leptolyngbya sp. FACHB-321 TaxID=2692807 RepID=UPI001688BE44|nr:hypothetical protein [Leptolyngbya sp. FACHB-321]MBD2033856.1 hypothetical protein [Leptolyngbya sp. FACHB-321]